MVKISEIVNRYSLEAWLESWPTGTKAERERAFHVVVAVANRAAMRLLPAIWAFVELPEQPHKRHWTALPFLRSNLISGAACKLPAFEIRSAAAAANSAATAAVAANSAANSAATAAAAAAANSAATATAYAAYAAAYATATAAAAAAAYAYRAADLWPTIRTECEYLLEHPNLSNLPLWPGGDNPFQHEWDTLKSNLPSGTTTHSDESARGGTRHIDDWSFWLDWYQRALDGTEDRWDLLQEIALQESDFWEGEDWQVNQRINAIWERYSVDEVIRQSPYALRVEVDGKTRKLASFPSETPDLTQVVATLRSALRDFVSRNNSDQSANRIGQQRQSAFAEVVKVLRRDVSKFKDKPIDLFDKLDLACREIWRTCELDGFQRDTVVGRLLDALNTSSDDICILSPDVEEMRKNRAGLRFKRMTDEHLSRALTLCEGMQSDSKGQFKLYSAVAIATIRNPEASEDEKKAAWYFIQAMVPRGAKAKSEFEDEPTAKEPPTSSGLDKGAAIGDKLSKVDKGIDALQEAGSESAGWITEVYTQISSGHWFGFGS